MLAALVIAADTDTGSPVTDISMYIKAMQLQGGPIKSQPQSLCDNCTTLLVTDF